MDTATRPRCEGRIVDVLGGGDECSEEDTMESPFFCLNQEVRFGLVDVDKGHQDGGHLDVHGVQDVCDELCKISVLFVGGGGSAESVGSWTEGQEHQGARARRCKRREMMLVRIDGVKMGVVPQCGQTMVNNP